MRRNASWYSEEAGVFDKDSLVHSELTLTPKRTNQEINFIERILSIARGSAIIDVPCGYGRHAVELAKRGYSVTGVELNRMFLIKAKENARKAGVHVRLQRGDMLKLRYKEEFAAAINIFTSLGYFETDEEDRRFFKDVYHSLKTQGQFVVDFTNRDWLVRNFKKNEQHRLPGGITMLIEREFDPVSGKMTEQRTKRSPTKKKARTVMSTLRLYTANELIALAQSAGFVFEAAFGDFDGSPLSLTSRRIILLFRK